VVWRQQACPTAKTPPQLELLEITRNKRGFGPANLFRRAVYLAVRVVPWHTFNLIDRLKARDEKSHIYFGSERAAWISIE
jgi:hypothetical protein